MQLKWRVLFAALGAMGMAIIYGLKVNLSVAIVAMVNQTAIKALNEGGHQQGGHGPDDHLEGLGTNSSSASDSGVLICAPDHPADGAGSEDGSSGGGTLVWTEPEQGLVLGSYFWGYLVTQIPGGRIAELYSGKWVFFIAVAMNIVGTVLSPVCATYGGYTALIGMRILEGLGGGLTFPAMNVLIAAWSPNQERSTISSIVYGGTAIGTVLSLPSAGLIAAHPALGWEGIFYIQGGLAVVWCLLWAFLVYDSPEKHPFASDAEKTYIRENQMRRSTKNPIKRPVPWKKILTSPPFLALMLAHVLNNFCWYMLLVELPTFLSVGLGFAITENALLSAVPFLCNWLVSIIYSSSLDKCIAKKLISITNARKLSQIIASVIPGVSLIGVCLAGCDRTACVALMIVATAFFGTMFSGVFSNHVDIASNFAGILMGITNMAATLPGFMVPAMVGAMTHGKPGLGPWHDVFYITAGLLGLEVVVYGFFASGEEQPWNRMEGEVVDPNEKLEMVGSHH